MRNLRAALFPVQLILFSFGNTFGWLCKLGFAVLILCSTAFANTVTYDLKNDWGTTNPNGPWSFLQGTNLLPYQSACASFAPGCAPAEPYLPVWSQISLAATANPPYYQPGDIWTHSVDGYNGNPGAGESILKWTAPVAGTIDLSGDIWYLHGTCCLDRSNDFFLYLDNTLLASGTVSGSGANQHTLVNPIDFSSTADVVKAGDTVTLVVQRSANEDTNAGSEDGVNLTITETPAQSQVPEPSSLLLLGTGLLGVTGAARRKWLG